MNPEPKDAFWRRWFSRAGQDIYAAVIRGSFGKEPGPTQYAAARRVFDLVRHGLYFIDTTDILEQIP